MQTEWQAFIEAYVVPAQLVFAMLGMGATLSARDFIDVLRRPRAIAIGLVLQMVVVPLIALAFTLAADMPPGWAVGLLLVSVVPGGAFSNLLTYFGRGNTPLSISLTVAATVACVATVPLMLQLTASSHLPPDFSFPTLRIIRDIVAYLMLPLVVGMVVYRARRDLAPALSRWAIRVTLALLVLITVSSLRSGRIEVAAYGWRPPLLIVGFGLALAIIIPHLCRLLGRYDDDTLAIGVEVTVRNVGVALLLLHFFFPGSEAQGHVLYTCLFYAGFSGFMAIPQVLLHRRGRSPVLLRRVHRRPPVQRPDAPPTPGDDGAQEAARDAARTPAAPIAREP